jgi:hypothetical protein
VPFAGALVTAALWISTPAPVAGFAGERGSGDGPDPAFQELKVSTHHTHLTRALAYCAGFPALTDHRNPVNPLILLEDAPWAERIALYDQLTDTGTISAHDADGNPVEPLWTNRNTLDWTYELPTAAAVGCTDTPVDTRTMVYPITQESVPRPIPDETVFDPASGAFTHRFGPWVGRWPTTWRCCGPSPWARPRPSRPAPSTASATRPAPSGPAVATSSGSRRWPPAT